MQRSLDTLENDTDNLKLEQFHWFTRAQCVKPFQLLYNLA